MANAELGTKRVCPETGRKFYDLNKDPVVSPFTGKTYPLSFFDAIRSTSSRASKRNEEVEETEVAEETENEETVSLSEVEEDEVGAGGVRGADQGADVPGVADLVEHDHGERPVIGQRLQRGGRGVRVLGGQGADGDDALRGDERSRDAARPGGGRSGRDVGGRVSRAALAHHGAQDLLVDEAGRDARLAGEALELGVRVGGALGEVHLKGELGTVREEGAHGLRPLDAEASLLATRRAPGQRRHLPHPLGAGGGDRGLIRALGHRWTGSDVRPRGR